MSEEHDSLVGRVINDKYRLVERVAEGGMAVVYKAQHLLLDDVYAIKIIKHNLSSQDEMLKRFKREFRLTQAVQRSPYIIKIYDFGLERGIGFFYAMELLYGQLLTGLVNPVSPPPEAERMARITLQICEAMGVVHEQDVVHRDLKPDNIFLHTPSGSEEEMVKLLDFGIARKTSLKATMLTSFGRVVGTPEYMSPEQCKGPTQEQYERGESHLDGRSDIYSLGILFYEGLTGHVPFPMEDPHSPASIPRVMAGHVKETPIPPHLARPDLGIPVALGDVAMKALAKAPEDRFQTMLEFRDAILAVYPHLGAYYTPPVSTSGAFQQPVPPSQELFVEEPAAAENHLFVGGQQEDLSLKTSFDVQLPDEVRAKAMAFWNETNNTEKPSNSTLPFSQKSPVANAGQAIMGDDDPRLYDKTMTKPLTRDLVEQLQLAASSNNLLEDLHSGNSTEPSEQQAVPESDQSLFASVESTVMDNQMSDSVRQALLEHANRSGLFVEEEDSPSSDLFKTDMIPASEQLPVEPSEPAPADTTPHTEPSPVEKKSKGKGRSVVLGLFLFLLAFVAAAATAIALVYFVL